MTPEEERLVERLAESLAPGRQGPSEERVAAVRAHAERWREQAAQGSAGPVPVSLAERRRRREVLTGALAAAVGAALGVVGSKALDDGPPPAAPTEAVDVAAAPGVDAEAVLIDHTWGVEVILTATGLTPGGVYRSAVQPADGAADVPAGSFLGVDDVTVVCRMNASILRAASTSFTVVDEQGTTVITGRFA